METLVFLAVIAVVSRLIGSLGKSKQGKSGMDKKIEEQQQRREQYEARRNKEYVPHEPERSLWPDSQPQQPRQPVPYTGPAASDLNDLPPYRRVAPPQSPVPVRPAPQPAQARPAPQPTPTITRAPQRRTPAAAAAEPLDMAGSRQVSLDRRTLVQAVIMREVLGPPRAMQRRIR